MSQNVQEAGRIPEITLGWRLQIALGGMPVQQMADTLGVSRTTISRWINERGAPPKKAYVSQWALATGVSEYWLRTGCGIRDSNPEPSGLDDGPCSKAAANRPVAPVIELDAHRRNLRRQAVA